MSSKTLKRARSTTSRSRPTKNTAVDKAWMKFLDKFIVFKKTPHNEKDQEIHKAWQRALEATDRAAKAVAKQRATCLRDMELKIQAWAFQSGVNIGKGTDLKEIANWRPNEEIALNSELIASLRDDIVAMKQLAWGASIAVGSIASGPPPMPDVPIAEPYPKD
jgi:hypothetical protein